MTTTQAPTPPPAALSATQARRVAVAALAGTAMEWYDYYLFGLAAALVFNRLYFTTLDPQAAALAAFATFGVGFVARPLGAILFGTLGDRIGRRPTLVLSVVLIGTATALIGLLPDFASIGIAAPVLLVLLRLVQGVAVGGEWSGAMTIAVEHAPARLRNRLAALVQLSSPIATLLSSGAFSLVLLLPAADFDAWGWRLPFLAAIPMLLVAVWLRRRIEESPAFVELVGSGRRARVPVLQVISRAPGRLGIAILVSLLGVGGFYFMNTFLVNFGSGARGLDRQLMVNATLIAAVVQVGVTLLSGRLAERFGPGRVTLWGGLATAVVAFPVFWLVDSRQPVAAVLAVCLGLAAVILAYGVAGPALTMLFPSELRYSGVSLGYNLAAVVGGFLPLLAQASLGWSGNASWGPALLFAVFGLATALGGALAHRVIEPASDAVDPSGSPEPGGAMTLVGRRIAAVAAAGAVALLLAGCASPEPEPRKLTASEAGTRYLSAVCPVNQAWDRADVELDRLRLVLARGSTAAGKAQTAPFSEAMGEVGAASTRAAEELGSPGIVWPKAAAPTIDAVRASLAADAGQAKRVAKLDAAEAIAYRWDPGDAAESDTRARAALGLTGEPQAACAQWRAEQQQKQKQAKSKSSGPAPSTGAPKEQQ